MIPKIIHYCWFGGAPLPELAQKCIASWKKYCPDYEIKEWNEHNIDVTSVAYMYEAYKAKAWGFVPDVARLQIIYNNGGIYLDTDVELIKSLDNLLEQHAFMGIEDEKYIALGLGFGAEATYPFVKKLLDQYQNLHFINKDGTLNKRSAPSLQKTIFEESGFNGRNEKQEIEGAVVYPSEYFCPLSYTTGILNITTQTYSIHHYNGSWLNEKQKAMILARHNVYKKAGRFAPLLWPFVHVYLKIRQIGFLKSIQIAMKRIFKI